jgi:hypothetical protein
MKELEEIFRKYMEEITFLNGELVIVKSTLKYYYKDFSEQDKYEEWIGSISPYRDIRIKEGHFGVGDFSSSLNKKNLSRVFKRIESRESLFILSQCYETFESFLKRILVKYIESNPDKIELIPKYKYFYESSLSASEFINNLQRQGKNNRILFWVIRKFSEDFGKIETDNFYKLKFNIWFDLISDIRHIIVHQRLRPDDKFVESLKENKKQDIFNASFFMEDNLIFSNSQIGSEIIKLNSLAFLVLTCLKN